MTAKLRDPCDQIRLPDQLSPPDILREYPGHADGAFDETPIGTLVVFREPDNIQLEFWLPAGQ